MTIISISRGSHSMGKEVAEKVAEQLSFECLSRDVLLEASGRFNTPEILLQRAIEDAPSFLDRFTHGKQGYIAYIQYALTKHLLRDNIVYHGLAGHVLLPDDVSHLLKVRIVAEMDHRIRIVMERDKLNERDAAQRIASIDNERKKWMRSLYNVDPSDPMLYDLIIKIPRFSVEDVVSGICDAAKRPQFATTPDSRRTMEDFTRACEVKAMLLEKFSDIHVASRGGNISIYTSSERTARKLRTVVKELCSSIEGINHIEVHSRIAPSEGAV